MRRKGAGHLFLSVSDPSAPSHYYSQSSITDSAQSESSHCRSSTSRFQRGGLPDLVEPSTFSRALRFVSRSDTPRKAGGLMSGAASKAVTR